MAKIKEIWDFSYPLYNRIITLKFPEVLFKEFFKLFLFTSDRQKKRLFTERLGFLPALSADKAKAQWVWVHANAIGEVAALRELIRVIRQKYPDARVLLTSANLSADEKARQMGIFDAVAFFPYDLNFALKRFIGHFRIAGVIITEVDVWPNFVRICRQNHIPVFLVSGICTDKSSRSVGMRYFYDYRFIPSREVLENIEFFCMQSEDDVKELFTMIPDANRIAKCGNLKLSEANSAFCKDAGTTGYYPQFNIDNGSPVFVAGNVHLSETAAVLAAFKKVKAAVPAAVMILAPRLLQETAAMEGMLRDKSLHYVKKTTLDNGRRRVNEEVILLDTMGELADIYSLAKVAFVGGSLVNMGDVFSGHNIIEPARFGVTVLFGAYMNNFRVLADTFLREGLAVEVKDADELFKAITGVINNSQNRERVRQAAEAFFARHNNVAEQTFGHIAPFLDLNSKASTISRECIACAGNTFKFIIGQGDYTIYRCNSCGLVFTSPLLQQEQLKGFYENFAFNQFEAKYSRENAEIAARVIAGQLKVLRSYAAALPGADYLDIGCGNGYYCFGAKENGLNAVGVDLDTGAAEFAEKNLGINVLAKGLEECNFSDNRFGLINSRQLIEHLPEPLKFLKEVYRILKPGGFFVLETANTQSLEHIVKLYFLDALRKIKADKAGGRLDVRDYLKAIKREWGFVDPPRHIFGFNAHNLKLLCEKAGFQCLKTLNAPTGDAMYYPLTRGHRQFLRKSRREALMRLRKRSFAAFYAYILLFAPLMFALRLWIVSVNNGSHLVIYCRKEQHT